jgi:cytoskeletal protein CcmA (bactofilin family)
MWRKQTEGKSSPSFPGQPESAPKPSPGPSAPAAKPSSTLYSTSAPSSSTSDSSLLTKGIRVKGSLTGKGELEIDGEVVGTIRLGDSRVVVGPNGIVKADIEARDVAVRGTVDGNLRGQERVLLGSTSRVNGNIESGRVAMEDGARFHGRVEMIRPGEPRNGRETPRKPAVTSSNPSAVPAPASVPVSSSKQDSVPAPVEVPGVSR